MYDFFKVSKRSKRRGVVEIYPEFLVKPSNDLMIRGGDFYAIWMEDQGLWSTDIFDAIDAIDKEIAKVADEESEKGEDVVYPMYLRIASTKFIDAFKKYCQRQMSDKYHNLDEKLIFANTPVRKRDYASKRLPYALEDGECPAYERLISTLYEPEERHKIEWAIGAVVSGDSKKIQKFIALYGEPGSGKGTILDIILDMFGGTDPKTGYCSVFDARALGAANNAFALEDFRSNPLVAVQQDGDLSRVEDNTKLNSLVSHEVMTVNEKFKSTYSTKFNAFLFIGTNKPVRITDSRSGLIRRLIDVAPSGNKIKPKREYDKVVKQVRFEFGAIAKHCLDVYLADPTKYDDYVPLAMLGASNDFYNFMSENYYIFKEENGVTLKAAWAMYNTYCEDTKVPYPYSQRVFKEELRSYFREVKDRFRTEDGVRVRNYYFGFKSERFGEEESIDISEDTPKSWLEFKERKSLFDKEYEFLPAQYASENDKPIMKWDQVKLQLKDIDTTKTHFVLPPKRLVCVDFDIPDEDGNKCYERNFEEASKWPATYAELSKSGAGIHLYYIYTGDISKLSKIYAPFIEVKTFTGKSSLRRRLSKCNDVPIKTISSGLPVEEGKKMVDQIAVLTEKQLRTLIKNCLQKKHHGATAPEVNYIYDTLEKMYSSGKSYDVSNMASSVFAFCVGSTNQSENCIKLFNKMHFMSKDHEEQTKENLDIEDYNKAPIVIFDCEVFPNLLLVCYKFLGDDKKVTRLINPSPKEVENLLNYRLVGFNCRRYDNHILYARMLGYSNAKIYDISQRIIAGDKKAFFKEAHNASYTDVLDFSSVKQSLKKFEIDYAKEFEKRYERRHKELGYKWDEPVPEEKWDYVAEYCDNDVYATELVYLMREADFKARLALSKLAGMTPNDTTNTLTGKIIFGKDRKPQVQFNYRFMGDEESIVERKSSVGSWAINPNFNCFDKDGRPIFPGYTFDHGKSIYRGEEVGEGGYVYAEPGMYTNVALLDIASMHPSSIVAENLFGDKYTAVFNDILQSRIAIKHKDYDKARTLWDGKLAPFLDDEDQAKDLAQALKIAINSVYGLTAASFDNLFRDSRNIDNIVAKRGALFMVNLKHEVQNKGFTVAHIKTDSIKIPNATPEIIQFVMDYGKLYGYNFEHEDTYDRICLVNDAVYIAKYTKPHIDKNTGKEIWWAATGKQFQVPFIFKTLFSKEPIDFYDLCETSSVQTAIYLDFNEDLPEGEHNYIFVGKIGQFTPVKTGAGGGILLREGKDKEGNVKYSAVSGSKGYRWMEADTVRTLKLEDQIDISYYTRLATDAINTISKYGDYEWFVS